MNMHKTFFKLQSYLAILLEHQQNLNQNLVMTFDRGYWWCTSDKKLNKLEQHFLEVGLDTDRLLTELEKSIDDKETTLLLHLLGWANDKSKAGNFLEQYVSAKNPDIANAALRSLFPLVVNELYELDSSFIHKLLYSRSLLVKNKILGLLAFMPKEKLEKILTVEDKVYIKHLTKHRNKALAAKLAELVVNRW